jgi:hypothetical protein
LDPLKYSNSIGSPKNATPTTVAPMMIVVHGTSTPKMTLKKLFWAFIFINRSAFSAGLSLGSFWMFWTARSKTLLLVVM